MNYYNLHDYISNSDLGALQDALNLTSLPQGIGEIFDFGNLVDSLITEPHLVNKETRTIKDFAKGGFIQFSSDQFKKGLEMRDAAFENDFLRMIIKDAKFQYVFLRKAFRIEYEGMVFYLPVRCKFDIYNKSLKIGADIKTTACTTLKSFAQSIQFFNYDRQGAWYMDLGGLQKMVYFGISKNKNRYGKFTVFTYVISKGDETYETGKRKYSKLAYRYKHLIFNLNL